MKTSGVGCEPKFGLLGFLGHPTQCALILCAPWVINKDSIIDIYLDGDMMQMIIQREKKTV